MSRLSDPSREASLRALLECIDRAQRGDASGVLAESTAAVGAELVAGGAAGPEALAAELEALSWFHWLRFSAAAAPEDLYLALVFFAQLGELDHRDPPARLGALLEAAREENIATIAAIHADRVLSSYLETRDRGTRDAADRKSVV